MTGTVEMLAPDANGLSPFGVDYSFSRPSVADMQALEVRFASRYVCIDNALTHDKLVTLDEIRRLADAGILMMVNYEQGETTTLGGDAAGRKHGKIAAEWRSYLGMPPDLPMPISTDIGVTSSQYSAIADFCAAFKEESGGPIGHYHGTALCAYLEDRGLNDLTWMAMATSWSPGGDPKTHETSAVHVRQKGYVLNGSCDANYVRKPTPFWNFNGEAPPQPKILEEDMPALFETNDAIHWPGSPTLPAGDYPAGNPMGIVFALEAGAVRHVPSAEYQVYVGLGSSIAVVTGADLKGMLDAYGVYTKDGSIPQHTHDVSGSRPL